MFKHRLGDQVRAKTYFDWFLLSFAAGSVNAGGFLACGRFVSHVTGFATLAGVDAASFKFVDAIGMLTAPVFFLLGVMVSAYLIDRPLQEKKQPHYAIVISAVTACLATAMICGQLGWFGDFGHAIQIQQDYVLLALLCGASGLQNAALTSSSGASIRTTHLTGVTTDLGIGMMRAASLLPSDPALQVAQKVNAFRFGSIVCFTLGSWLGAVVFLKFKYIGFLLPTLILSYATWMAVTEK